METIPNQVKQIFLCLKHNTMILGFPELELNFTKSVLYLKWSYFSTLVQFVIPWGPFKYKLFIVGLLNISFVTIYVV